MFKKKILMVGQFPPTVGGITTCIQTILTSNLNKRFKFIPFTTSRPTIGIIKDVLDYTLLFHIGLKNLFRSALTTLYHIIKFPIVLIIMKPKIIHIHTTNYWPFWESSIYVFISKFFLRKTILHIHAGRFTKFYNTGNTIQKILIKKTLMIADKIIILSSLQKKLYMKFVPEDKLTIITNVVNFKTYQDQSILKLKEKNLIKVLFIGGEESKRKGIYDIIESIPIVIKGYGKNILFIFIGRCDIKRIRNICKKKKIEKYVDFRGYVEESIKIKILNSSDIFVLPSYAEGLPISLLEAMAAGLPVISTPVGSIPDVIKEEVHGYLINPGDYYALADMIIKLSKDSILRKKNGEKNKETILKKYDVKILTDKLSKLYDELTLMRA